MDAVSVRELRNHGGEVLTRVAHGESLIVTRDGAEVAEIRPLRRATAPTSELIARRAALPAIDVDRFTADLDGIVDATL